LVRIALLFVGVSALPATEDVREQVQANAARCATIGRSLWLAAFVAQNGHRIVLSPATTAPHPSPKT